MIVLHGKYNHARVMIDHIDATTQNQIVNFLNHPVFSGSPIVIMPDCHSGKGAVIGFTMPLRQHVIPNVIGVDLGCGVYAYNLGKINIKFKHLDHFIRANIPSGHAIRTSDNSLIDSISTKLVSDLEMICSRIGEDLSYTIRSIGTLGGGNHYIELDRDKHDNVWLVLHSGSRHFGLAVATYYQKKAKQLAIKMFLEKSIYNGLEFLPLDIGGNEYLADARIAQIFADLNRECMARVLLNGFFNQDIKYVKSIKSVHNYIGDDNIIRKGAISAHDGEQVIIPLNMRDGAIIGIGKGIKAWNFSAPHGAGRNYSRKKAREKFTLDQFEKEMANVWSSCVKTKTLDESPMAYKDASDILENINETVDVQEIIKPIYNFKAS